MKGRVLIAIGIFWLLALVSIVFYVDHAGYGIGFDLPFPANAQNIARLLFAMTVLLGWLPTLAVGIFRVVSKQ